jgi:neutral trehalase
MIMQENKDLACSNIIAITHEKTEEGFIPNLGGADDNKTRDRSQPPVGSFTLREFYKKYQEKWLVEYLFDDLLGWNRWFASSRRLENGCLCWGSKPFKDAADRPMRLEQMGTSFGAALESGMDNSPMYDDIPINKSTWMMELADVGLTGLYILDCRCLAYLAKVTGRSESAELEERACLSEKGLETVWDEESGIYLNRRTDTGNFSRRLSPANFYALFSDAVPEAHVHRMIQEHFYNSQEFYGEYMMPAISRDDPAYKDQVYWRGRIWAPTNYLVYIALAKQGQDKACRTLAEKSRKLLLKEWLSHGHVHENYNCDTGEGCDSRSSDKFYHWGGLLSLIALMDGGYVEKPDFKRSTDG